MSKHQIVEDIKPDKKEVGKYDDAETESYGGQTVSKGDGKRKIGTFPQTVVGTSRPEVKLSEKNVLQSRWVTKDIEKTEGRV